MMFRRLRNIFSDGSQNDPNASSSDSAEESEATLLSRWSSRSVADRDVEIFIPKSEEPARSAVLFLHGHGGICLSDNATYSRLFQQHNLIAVAPDGGQSWWLDCPAPDFDPELTPQQWLLSALIPFVEAEFQIAPPQIALLGVSMGGQGVLQLAYRHASRFPVVSAVAPAVDFDQLYGSGIPLDQMFPDAESARQSTVVLNLHPLSWPRHQFFCCDPEDVDWIDGAARLGMKLSSSGILHERDLQTSAGGHSWDYFNYMADAAMDNIVKGLQSVE